MWQMLSRLGMGLSTLSLRLWMILLISCSSEKPNVLTITSTFPVFLFEYTSICPNISSRRSSTSWKLRWNISENLSRFSSADLSTSFPILINLAKTIDHPKIQQNCTTSDTSVQIPAYHSIFNLLQMGDESSKMLLKQSQKIMTKKQYPVLQSARRGVRPTKKFDSALNPQNKRLVVDLIDDKNKPVSSSGQSDQKPYEKLEIKVKLHKLVQFTQKEPVQIPKDACQYPYSAVGMISGLKQVGYDFVTTFGTGVLIGANLVLTCAHNVYNLKHHKMIEHLKFVPSCLPNVLFNRGFLPKAIFIPKGYMKECPDQVDFNRRSLYDYAVILLDTNINMEDYFGSIGYDFLWQSANIFRDFTEDQVCVDTIQIGYPLASRNYPLTEFKGECLEEKYFFFHSMKTKKGMDGAPIMTKEGEEYMIRGVHLKDIGDVVRSAEKIRYQVGLKLNAWMFQDITRCFGSHLIHIHHFHFTKQHIEDVYLKKILESNPLFKSHEDSLLTINLSSNLISDQGCLTLSRAKLSKLYALDLSSNRIGSNGCKYLAQAQWPDLHTLILMKNQIGDEGCWFLLAGVWLYLYRLDLSFNCLGDQGCSNLSMAKNWESLKYLFLYGNIINREGYDCFKGKNWVVLGSVNCCIISQEKQAKKDRNEDEKSQKSI